MNHTKTNSGDPEKLKHKFWESLTQSPFLFLQKTNESSTAVPMSPQLDKNANSAIWFFTTKNSAFANLGPVTATFSGKSHNIFARFEGTLAEETSRERFDHFWNNFVESWYEHGKNDPSLLFLRMDLGNAEIWDADMGLLNVAKMALGMYVERDAEKQHTKQTPL